MDLLKSLNISASGLKAQGTRMRVISENIANADSECGTFSQRQDPNRIGGLW